MNRKGTCLVLGGGGGGSRYVGVFSLVEFQMLGSGDILRGLGYSYVNQ